MNTHDKIELPPLPDFDGRSIFGKHLASKITVLLENYATAAIEADRQCRQSEAEEVCGEAYQVVGSLLSDLGIFETDHAKKILDNLSQTKMVHKDVLPWPSFDRQRRGESAMRVGAWLSAALDDPNVCGEMKADIRTWMDAGMPTPQPAEPDEERLAMEAVMESVDPATWPGLTLAQRCALGRFAKPQPAGPVRKTDWNNELSSWSDEDFIRIFHERPDLANRLRKMLAEPVKRKRRYAQGTALGEFGIIPMCDQADDEPVKVSSDADAKHIRDFIACDGMGAVIVEGPQYSAVVRALLARYGQTR